MPDMRLCAECGRPLTSLAIGPGWITVQVGWSQTRVHTVCRKKFEERPFDDQKQRAA